MDGQIGHFQVDYTFWGQSDAAAVARLNTIVQNRLLVLLENALDALLGDDPTVYVLRRIRLRFALNLENIDDVQLTREWVSQIIRAVSRQLAGVESGVGIFGSRAEAAVPAAGELVRFENQSEFVAQFITDLLRGEAWDRWYFGAFSAFRHQPVSDALLAVLLENVNHLPAILAALHQRNQLDACLRRLDDRAVSLWRAMFADHGIVSVEMLYPLAESVFSLFASLNLWQHKPDLSALAAEYAAAPPDWNDPRSLATAALEIARLAQSRGWLRVVAVDSLDWGRALQPFDWLDIEWLSEMLPRLLDAGALGSPAYPLRITEALTPRSRRLLDDLLNAPDLRPNPNETREASALRLLAALIAYRPEWNGDPLALSLIRRILVIWEALRSAPVPLRLLDNLMRGTATLSGTPPTFVIASAPLLRQLLASTPVVPEAYGEETACAGLFLLIRILQDTRAVALAQRAIFPDDTPFPLLVALAFRWAGGVEQSDAGIAVFAGLEPESAPSPTDWSEAWAAMNEPAAFEAVLMDALVGLRLLDADWTPSDMALTALTFGRVGVDVVDAVLDRLAAALLLGWGRWLRGFESSTVPFLLDSFVRRRGWLRFEEDTLWVTLERGPLDIVLEMSGYTSDVERVPWLSGRRVQFRIQEHV